MQTILITTRFDAFVNTFNQNANTFNTFRATANSHFTNTSNPHNTTAVQVPFTANNTSNVAISSTNVQAAIEETYKELNEAKANRSGDTFTGNVTLPSFNLTSGVLVANATAFVLTAPATFNNAALTHWTNNANTTAIIETYSNTAATFPTLRVRRSRGTQASPLHANATFVLGRVALGSSFFDGAVVEGRASQNHGASAGGTEMVFYTTTNGTTTLTQRAILTNDGNLGVGNTAPTDRLSVEGTIRGSANATFVGTTQTNAVVSNTYTVGTSNFVMSVAAANQHRLTFDTNDFINYNIQTDVFGLTINNVTVFSANSTVASANNFALINQPTANNHATRKDYVDTVANQRAIVYAIALG